MPKHGGYKELLSYRKSEIVFDATVYFCNHYIEKRSRTHDQMVQAARSGKQNIVEGTMASGTSKETELRLLNVARASLEELLTDYQDFLRTRKCPQWTKDSKEAVAVRKLAYRRNADGAGESYATYKPYIETRAPEVVANIIICLVHQANYLLNQQIRSLEKAFVKEGGIRERMTRARLQYRVQHKNEDARGEPEK